MPLVDVVIVNFNGGAYLRRAVAALQAQTFGDFRIIVIDNASTDGSADGLPDAPASLRVVRSPRNLGFAGGNNLALREHATAEWIALLNPDAFPQPDWLQRLMEGAAAHPGHAFFGCRLVDAADATRLDGTGDVYHVSGLHWRDGHGCPNSPAYDRVEEIFSPCAAAALYRRDDLESAGAFDEDFFCYAEDVDLGFRLRLRGLRCLYLPDAIVEHVGSGITGVRSNFSLYHGHRNLVWAYVKNMPAALFWAYLPYHLLLNLYSLFIFTLRGQGAPLWRAKRDALLGLPGMWRKRRAIQAARRAPTSALRAVMRGGLPDKSCRRG